MAKKELTVVEKYYIEGHASKDIDTLAKEMGKKPDDIKQYHLECNAKVNLPNASALLGRKSGCVTMTQGASQLAEETKSKPRKEKPYISKIK